MLDRVFSCKKFETSSGYKIGHLVRDMSSTINAKQLLLNFSQKVRFGATMSVKMRQKNLCYTLRIEAQRPSRERVESDCSVDISV